MDIRQLRCFIVLAEELHFGRAAARLHLAQPALSQQLKQLEHELGVRLMHRSSRHVALTPAGDRLVEEATAVLARFDAALAAMAEVRAGDVGRLVVGMTPGVDPVVVEQLVHAAVGPSPGIDVVAREVTTRDAIAGLMRHELDVALLRQRPRERGLVTMVLAVEALGVALPSSHILASRRTVAPAALSGEPLVWMRRLMDPDVYDRVMGELTARGFEPGVARETPNVETSLSLVAAGAGISFKTRREAAGRVGVRWRPLAGDAIEVATVLAWRRTPASHQPPQLRRLLAAARVLVAQMRNDAERSHSISADLPS